MYGGTRKDTAEREKGEEFRTIARVRKKGGENKTKLWMRKILAAMLIRMTEDARDTSFECRERQ